MKPWRSLVVDRFKRVKLNRALSLMVILAVMMTGCGGNSGKDRNEDDSEWKVSNYYPILEDVKYDYEGQGNEFATFTVYNDYTSDQVVQQHVDNGGTSTVRVVRITDGKVIRMLSKGEVYYRENMLQKIGYDGEILLMEPLETDTNWTLADGSRRTITSIDTEMTVPAGTYHCIEVTTVGADSTTIDYYAKDVGLVKSVFRLGDAEISSELKNFEEKAARSQTVRFYYPDPQNGRIYYIEKEVIFQTNDDTAALLEAAYKGAVSEVLDVNFTTQQAIGSLSLDDENTVRLDLNDTVSDLLKTETPYEDTVLQCIADTFGGYYGAEWVVLTIDGKPYESSQTIMKENEPLIVNLEGITGKSD